MLASNACSDATGAETALAPTPPPSALDTESTWSLQSAAGARPSRLKLEWRVLASERGSLLRPALCKMWLTLQPSESLISKRIALKTASNGDTAAVDYFFSLLLSGSLSLGFRRSYAAEQRPAGLAYYDIATPIHARGASSNHPRQGGGGKPAAKSNAGLRSCCLISAFPQLLLCCAGSRNENAKTAVSLRW